MPLSTRGGVNVALVIGCPFRSHRTVGVGLPPVDEQVKDITEFSTSVDEDEFLVMTG